MAAAKLASLVLLHTALCRPLRSSPPAPLQDYARLLKDCQDLYCETRLALMHAPVAAHIRQCAASPLPSLLRSGCSYLMQVCVRGVVRDAVGWGGEGRLRPLLADGMLGLVAGHCRLCRALESVRMLLCGVS